METRMILAMCILTSALLCSCATPPTPPGIPAGYHADTTPTHNGETWIGGE